MNAVQGWNAACVLVGWRGHWGLRRVPGLPRTYSLHARGLIPAAAAAAAQQQEQQLLLQHAGAAVEVAEVAAVLPLAPEHGFLHAVVRRAAHANGTTTLTLHVVRRAGAGASSPLLPAEVVAVVAVVETGVAEGEDKDALATAAAAAAAAAAAGPRVLVTVTES